MTVDWQLSGNGLIAGVGFPAETTVRDAMHDRIPLSAPELSIIGTPEFLRLDRIQQLGFVSRIWPGARHARYDHSLGVLHLVRLAVAHLMASDGGNWITIEDARSICAAALLHDIGHYPFSHAIEELGAPIVPHERVGASIVEHTAIAGILRDQWGVDPARVAALIDPKTRPMTEQDRVLRGILSGPLDMDKLDYLPRDARGCNVPYGGVDTPRLIDALQIGDAPDDSGTPEQRIVIGAKGVSPLHSLINARQEMFDNVYWHHTNRACMAMLLRAVQEALLAGAIAAQDLTGLDDASLLSALSAPDMPAPTRRLIVALRERRIHKRAVEVSNRAVELYGRLGNLFFDPAARRAVELGLVRGLSAELGREIDAEAILIDIPKPEKWRTNVWVAFDAPPVGFQPMMPWRDVVGLTDDDFKRYEEHRRLIRIVVQEPLREDVSRRWEALLVPLLGGVV